ncbi:single-stranded DNA-binding protein [bacterium]|nr:single-stranded DNA-binding protein [bacterium]
MTLAKAVVTGTVYRKPQTGYSTNDVAVSSFTLDIGEKEETLIRVISKRTILSNVVESLEKGERVLVDGRLQVGNAKMDDGSERRVFEIDASNIERIGAVSEHVSSSAAAEGEIVKFSDELISEDEIPF